MCVWSGQAKFFTFFQGRIQDFKLGVAQMDC